MRKFLIYCLLIATMLNICGCAADAPAETEPVQIETTQEETTTPVETKVEVTVPTTAEGYLYFTVSAITFSLQGESEDIYVGSVPRELISWESSDESVATFENGILTATGVGTTSVSASYGEERLECTVGCLAQTQEELAALDEAILRSPKRYPPEISDSPITFFDDAAFVGDSISYFMFQWETKHNYLGEPLFLVRGGTGIQGFIQRNKQIYYKGKETNLEDALAQSGVKKVFIMLGQNDLSFRSIEDTMDSWVVLLDRIIEKSPDIEIYLQSCVPEWFETTANNEKNDKIDQYNILLKAFAEENGYHYVDIAPYIEDHTNNMATEYSQDKGIHMNEQGCYVWMQALKDYARLHNLRGE